MANNATFLVVANPLRLGNNKFISDLRVYFLIDADNIIEKILRIPGSDSLFPGHSIRPLSTN